MDITKHLWIGSTVDVRSGEEAKKALERVSDKQYWNDENGISSVSQERWEIAQLYEKECWLKHGSTETADRNDEHYRNFGEYNSLKSNLGRVVEIGCGPFTQLETILTRANKIAECITLVDPLLESYLTHRNCSYANSRLAGFPVYRMDAIPAEKFDGDNDYDTVISINVLDHVQDANLVLDVLYRSLKNDGVIVFHDRSWDHIDINIIYDAGHPIRLKKTVLDRFKSKFETLYSNLDYFIGRKS